MTVFKPTEVRSAINMGNSIGVTIPPYMWRNLKALCNNNEVTAFTMELDTDQCCIVLKPKFEDEEKCKAALSGAQPQNASPTSKPAIEGGSHDAK